MKNILIIGGSKGIGNAILLHQLENNYIYNISRNPPEITHSNLKHYSIDVLHDRLPEIENIDTLIYCPGSINLKPIGNLSLDDFRNDFEINVMGAVKCIQQYLPNLKKGNTPSILLFSTVAAKLGMPFHASIATAKAGIIFLKKVRCVPSSAGKMVASFIARLRLLFTRLPQSLRPSHQRS